jgi:hypothetical protein
MKIVGGLAAIAVVVAIIAMDRKEDEVTAAAVVPAERSFEAQDSAARFVVPEPPSEEAASGEAAPQD